MLKESLIFTLTSWVFQKLNSLYKNSGLCLIVGGLINFINRVWEKSFVKKILFSDFGFEERFKASALNKIFNAVAERLKLMQINPAGSRFIFLTENLLHFKLRAYGIILLIAGLLSFKNIYFCIGMSVVGLVLCLINSSAVSLLNGSFFARFALEYLSVNLPQPKEIKTNYLVSTFFGICIGLTALVNPLYALLAFVGLIGCGMIMGSVAFGVCVTVFLLPLLPTKFILGLAAVTCASFVLGLLTGKNEIRLHLMDLFVGLYALLLVYCVGISYIPSQSAYMAFVYVLFIMFYVAAKNTIGVSHKTLASVIILSGFLVALIGIYQKATGLNIDTEAWIDVTMFESTAQRVYSTLANPNVLGEYLIFVILLTFGSLYYEKNILFKLFNLAALVVMSVCMIFTLSRGAWLGLMIAMGVFVLLRDRRLIWLGVIALVMAPFVVPASVVERFLSIGNMNDTSTSYRVSIWLASTRMLKDFWPIGIGMSSSVFIFIFQRYAFSASYALHSHNIYLQILLDTGIWGFILFVSFVSVFFKNCLSYHKSGNFYKTVYAALAAGMAGYLAQGLTDNIWYNYRLVLFFWVIMAVGAKGKVFCEEEK